MKIYRHYKNKYYKLYNIAKHSEDLSELVFYECLYPNEAGVFWVRPKNLFFGDIEVDGVLRPRFEEVNVKIKSTTVITKEIIDRLVIQMDKILKPIESEKIIRRLQENPNSHLLLEAEWEGRWAGFKLGYALNKLDNADPLNNSEHSKIFYSWLGGVKEEFRNLGVATELMCFQHQWCEGQGFNKIQTKTELSFKNMIKLNLDNGFEIVDFEIKNVPSYDNSDHADSNQIISDEVKTKELNKNSKKLIFEKKLKNK